MATTGKSAHDVPLSSTGTSIQETSPQSTEAGAFGSSEPHVFSSASTADYWRKVYENANYENRHRFDPDFTWSADEERKLVRKVSGHVPPLPWALTLIAFEGGF